MQYMRNIYTLAIVLLLLQVSKAFAQIEIDYSDMAKDGDGFIYAVKSYRPGELNVQQLNRTGWDVSDIKPDTYDTVRFYSKRRSKHGKLFPNSELVRFQTKKNMEFITLDSSKMRMQGLINDYLGLKATVVIVFPTDLTVYKFPLHQGSYMSDSISKKFVSSYGLSQFADSVRIDLDMSSESFFDTCMTIKTPQDTYMALRERNTVYKKMVAYKNSHMMGWRPAPEFGSKSRIVYYRWFAKGSGIAVLEAETDGMDNVRYLRYQYRAPMDLSIEKEDVKCRGQHTGVARAVVSGGTPDYKYLWSNGKKTAQIDSLPAGKYSVTVTDCKGNTLTQQVVINEPDKELKLNIDYRDIRCLGDHDAYLRANVSGGTQPYYIVWSNDDEAQELVNQGTGVYGCIVRDANRCFVWDSVEIKSPKVAFQFLPEVVHSQCFGEPKGMVDFNVQGGDAPYRFWIGDSLVSQQVDNLMAGQYRLLAMDKWGCEISRDVNIRQPEKAMEVQGETTDVTCFGGNDGTITLKVSGGNPGYYYTWSDGTDTRDIAHLKAGRYDVTVRDTKNCTVRKTFQINTPDRELTMQCEVTNVTSHGGNNGIIRVRPYGGVAPYTITLNGKEKTPVMERLKTGSYSVKLTDKNKCMVIETVIVSEQGADD